jgi:1-acyl-sn-glycerol-3-phosphate acyltransferase
VFRSGTAFVLFGLTSFLPAIGVVPWIRLFSTTPAQRELRTQRLVHGCCVMFLRIVRSFGLMKVELRGTDRLSIPGTLVVANHPTLIDVVVLLSLMPQAYCVVKQASFANPFMRGLLTASGYLGNAGGQSVIDACAEKLRAGRSLILFPEGTRSPAGGLGPFQRGAAHLALTTGCDLLPAVITCDPPTLMKGQPWYDVPDRQFQLSVSVGETFEVREFVERPEHRVRVSRLLTANLREAFVKELAHARS